MLPKEKRRVGWSIAVGAVVAGLVAGYSHFQAFEANQRLHSLVAECKKQASLSFTEGSVAHPTSAQTADDPHDPLAGSTLVNAG